MVRAASSQAQGLPNRVDVAASLLLAPQGAIRTEERDAVRFFFDPDLEGCATRGGPHELNRRNFIEDSGFLAASTAGIATWSALHPTVRTARGEAVAPSETIQVALIGGGQGRYDLDVFMRSPEVSVAALCDVDQRHVNRTVDKVEKKYGKKPTTTVDLHAILERNDVDAAIIGTPDHWHAIPLSTSAWPAGCLPREADLPQHR